MTDTCAPQRVTLDEKDAMAGTVPVPSGSNKFRTATDVSVAGHTHAPADVTGTALVATGATPVTAYLDVVENTPPGTPAANTLRLYSEDFKGFTFFSFIDDTGMRRKIVRDSVFVGKNTTVSTIPKGTPVYASGSSGNVPTLAPALAAAIATMPAIGITIEAILAGAFGRVMQVGLLENFNTNAFAEGNVLYVAAAGGLTATAPLYPNIRQEMGVVLVKGIGDGAMQCIARSMFNEGIIDHGGLLGLTDTDHPSTALLCSATDVVIGRATALGGASEEIACTAAGRSIINGGLVPTAQLGSGVADGTTALFGDQTWKSPGAASIPAGIIVMWSGTLITIPAGWALCDGGGGRPDLRDKFIMGWTDAVDPGGTGGSNTHDHDDHAALSHAGTAVGDHSNHVHSGSADHSSHTHTGPSHSHALTGGTATADTVNESTHTHSITTPTGTESSHTHTYTQVPNHVHVQNMPSSFTGSQAYLATDTSTTGSTASAISTANPTGGVATGTTAGGSSHSHTITSPTGAGAAHKHALTGNTDAAGTGASGNESAALSHGNTGNNTTALSHSVTQPSDHAAQSHSSESNVPVYYKLAFIIKT